MTEHYLYRLVVALFAFTVSSFAMAENDSACTLPEKDCVAVGEWNFSFGIGAGGRTNPIVQNDDIPIILLPGVSYYGKRFFWENDTIGFTFHESKHHIVSVIGTVSYDQTYFNDWGVGSFSIEGGGGTRAGRVSVDGLGGGAEPPEAAPTPEPVSLPRTLISFDSDPNLPPAIGAEDDDQVDPSPTPVATVVPTPEPAPVPAPTPVPNEVLLDGADEPTVESADDIASGIDLDRLHDRDHAGLVGLEYIYNNDYLSFSLQGLQDITAVHHGRQLRTALSSFISSERSALVATLGAEWKDSKTLDYYYGVRVDEVDNPLYAFHVGSDLSYYLKLDWRYRLSRRWDLRWIVQHRWLADKVTESPIVDEDTTSAVFFGGVYHFQD